MAFSGITKETVISSSVYKMRVFLFVFVISTQIGILFANQKWPCDRKKAIEAFKKKNVVNIWPSFESDPYKNQTKQSEAEIQRYLQDHTRVCAIRYANALKTDYELRDFPDKKSAENTGFIVTHQGKCGACSNLKDLAVYLEQNLTKVVRACGARIFGFLIRKCLYNLGFTSPCVSIWEYNIYNTRKQCFGVCIKAWITGQPNNKPDGSLNDCLQCDEDKSGPVFKYFAGRTRRNSGITSAIHRPPDQIYNMTHCYF